MISICFKGKTAHTSWKLYHYLIRPEMSGLKCEVDVCGSMNVRRLPICSQDFGREKSEITRQGPPTVMSVEHLRLCTL